MSNEWKKQEFGVTVFSILVSAVWNLAADIAEGKEAEGVWEHGVEENIWTQEGRGNGGLEENA